jgi:hypothetical protein
MATFNKYQQFVEDLAKGVHNFTSDATCSVTLALSNTAGDADATKATLSQITQVSYTNLSSRVVTGVTAEHTTGTVTFTATDLILTASGGSVAAFRYIILYNDDPTSPADPLIGWYDYGSALTLADGETLTIDFGASGFGTLV